jgi:DNA-binding transcriptional regulator GbsR (MarR family)
MIGQEIDFKHSKMAENVFDGLTNQPNPVTAQEVAESLNLPIESVRYGIRLLIDQNLVFRYSNIADMRKTLYSVSDGSCSDSSAEIDFDLFQMH